MNFLKNNPMATKHNRSFNNKLKDKFRLIIYNDQTFEEVWYLRLSKLNFIALFSSVFIFIIAGIFALIAYTGIRELIPGYPDGNIRRTILMNSLRLDSLENELMIRDMYLENINAIIAGEEPTNLQVASDTMIDYGTIDFSKSVEDSILRVQIEEEEQYNLTISDDRPRATGLAGVHFFAPIRGIVSSPFDATKNHYGTDIVAAPNEVVKATLDGTVIMATWTVETGYVMQVQHKDNLISVYKHNAELLRATGSMVKAGDAIAIMGNSGELTTGPHLHFEIWHNGTPLNPEEYIVF